LAALAGLDKVGAMSLPQSLADIGLKAVSQAHRAIVHVSGGRVGGSTFGMPAVELHTVGRKSGLPRSTMLTAPVIDGDRVVLVASKGGDDRDPDRYRNLMANADIELTMAGRRRPMRARRASAHRVLGGSDSRAIGFQPARVAAEGIGCRTPKKFRGDSSGGPLVLLGQPAQPPDDGPAGRPRPGQAAPGGVSVPVPVGQHPGSVVPG